MNKILGYTILWFKTIVMPFFILLLFGEVGIRLYTDNIDKIFWTYLIMGYIITSALIYNFYSGLIMYEEDIDGG